jgi:hypothetical protein
MTEVPVAPEFSRPGLDPDVIRALQALDDLVRDMRIDVEVPIGVTDADSAVQRYLIYLSMLVDSVVADIGMSAMIKNDVMVLTKLRMLIEYSTKGAYYDEHPDYALYMLTIGEAKDILHKLEDANTDPQAIANAQIAVAELKGRFPSVAHFHRLKFDQLMTTYATRNDYVWVYRAPSSLLHGDPEGMRTLFKRLPNGNERLVLEFPFEQVNAMLVDAANNCLRFCGHFIGRFKPDNKALIARAHSVRLRFLHLLLKHPYGCTDEMLEVVRKEIAES